jgi:hypothetical protein
MYSNRIASALLVCLAITSQGVKAQGVTAKTVVVPGLRLVLSSDKAKYSVGEDPG